MNCKFKKMGVIMFIVWHKSKRSHSIKLNVVNYETSIPSKRFLCKVRATRISEYADKSTYVVPKEQHRVWTAAYFTINPRYAIELFNNSKRQNLSLKHIRE